MNTPGKREAVQYQLMSKCSYFLRILAHLFLFVSAVDFTKIFFNPLFLALGGTIFLQIISLCHDFIYLMYISLGIIGYGTGTILRTGNIVMI